MTAMPCPAMLPSSFQGFQSTCTCRAREMLRCCSPVRTTVRVTRCQPNSVGANQGEQPIAGVSMTVFASCDLGGRPDKAGRQRKKIKEVRRASKHWTSETSNGTLTYLRGAIGADADAVPLQGKAGWSRGRGLIRMLSPRPTLRLTDL